MISPQQKPQAGLIRPGSNRRIIVSSNPAAQQQPQIESQPKKPQEQPALTQSSTETTATAQLSTDQ